MFSNQPIEDLTLIEGLIFEASDDDLVGIKTNKHEGGLRGSNGHKGNGNAVGLDQSGLVFV